MVLLKGFDRPCDMWSLGVLCYLMLCGYPPFTGAANDTKIGVAVLRRRYTFPSKDWEGVSGEGARDFVWLETNWTRRMTTEDALNPSWIASCAHG